jgi:cytochrome c553
MKIPLKIKDNTKNYSSVKVSMILLMLVLFIGCEKTGDSRYNPPADHSISKDGYMHKSGFDQPLTNCVSCHGSDLNGGTTGVSCFECHGTKW